MRVGESSRGQRGQEAALGCVFESQVHRCARGGGEWLEQSGCRPLSGPATLAGRAEEATRRAFRNDVSCSKTGRDSPLATLQVRVGPHRAPGAQTVRARPGGSAQASEEPPGASDSLKASDDVRVGPGSTVTHVSCFFRDSLQT